MATLETEAGFTGVSVDYGCVYFGPSRVTLWLEVVARFPLESSVLVRYTQLEVWSPLEAMRSVVKTLVSLRMTACREYFWF